MLNALYVLDKGAFERIYGLPEREDIARLVNINAAPLDSKDVAANPDVLKNVEVIFSGWGCARLDQQFLDAAPNLKAIFYGAGSIRGIVTEEFWDRDIVITSAYAANAVPVAEYTLSQILFCLKSGWQYARTTRLDHNYGTRHPIHGAYRTTVGIISLGMVGRKVCELLKGFDVEVIAYDPFAPDELASELGVTLCSLEDIFARSHVVSLHAPNLSETQGMIRKEHFQAMQQYSSFINTARGAIVREDEMIEVLADRPDIQAVLDVTFPEPPAADSPLYDLPNVTLTPHIAGSVGDECRRMGRYMIDELERYLKGEKLHWAISREMAKKLA